MALNEKESRVLSRIRENPYISQKELANDVELSRSSVANIISGLVQKGYLSGRAYVINETRPIVCIGGFNVDRFYQLQDEFEGVNSNRVKTRTSAGGVARNVAENIGRMDIPVSILTMVGNDASWEAIRKLSQPYMNLDRVDILESAATGNFSEVHNIHGETMMALSEAEIYEAMTPEWLSKHQSFLEKAEVIVADTTIPKDTLGQLISFGNRMRIPVVLVVASIPTLENLPYSLQGVRMVLSKHDETGRLFGLPMETDEDLLEGLRAWRRRGAESVFLVQNSEKIAHSNFNGRKRIFSLKNPTKETYQWGVCEALCAGWLYGKHQEKTQEDRLWCALANATATMEHGYTVRPNLSQKVLEHDYLEIQKQNLIVELKPAQ